MQQMKNLFLFSILLLATTVGHLSAQDMATTPLRWVTAEAENLNNNDKFAYSCAFVSSPTQIRWEQKNGTRVNTFTITSATGTWSNVALQGKRSLTIKEGSQEGTITFEKTSIGTTITLIFSGTHGSRHRFSVSQVQLEN
jgi:hypothetical protein